MEIEKRLGANVRRVRRAMDKSQEALADEAGLHRTYISDIERGVRNPTIKVIEKIAGVLKVSAASLLEEPANT